MTNTPESNNNSNNDNDAGYYAVDPQRVIQVFELFQMRPSHFSAGGKAGAQGIYYDARKIIEHRTNNKWGHHTQAAIKSFCHFTQSEHGALLPWQELIEYRGFYNGTEGAGRRTGNLLLTENRLQLHHEAMIEARHSCGFSQQQLAEKLTFPLRFIAVLESGDWQTVSENTADQITAVLAIEKKQLFTQIPDTTELKESVTSSRDAKAGSHDQKINGQKIMNKAGLGLLLLVFGLLFAVGSQFYPFIDSHEQTINKDKVFNSLPGCWNWSNGAYIVINDDGTAQNGLFGASWKLMDAGKRRYTITWPSFVDTLSLSDDADVLSGKNNFNLPISATRKSGVGSGLVGSWLWSNGTTVIFNDDNTMSTSLIKGTWHRAGTHWIIEWPLVDVVTLSEDGYNLTVKNPYAVFTAKRNVTCNEKLSPE